MIHLLTHPTIQRSNDSTIQRSSHHQTTKLPNHPTIQEALP
jgi:hypothetical protein